VDTRSPFPSSCKESSDNSHQMFKRFHSRHWAILLKAFTTSERPLLECATPVWSPYTVTNITKIESLQRSFTKRLQGLCNRTYTKRLESLSIDSLEIRQLHYDLVFTALHGMQTRSYDENFVCPSVRPSVRPSVCLSVKRVHCDKK